MRGAINSRRCGALADRRCGALFAAKLRAAGWPVDRREMPPRRLRLSGRSGGRRDWGYCVGEREGRGSGGIELLGGRGGRGN